MQFDIIMIREEGREGGRGGGREGGRGREGERERGREGEEREREHLIRAVTLSIMLNSVCYLGSLLLQVRQARNAVMHTAKFEVTSADLTAYLATMTALLQEPAVHNYASARSAIVEITKVIV